MKWTVDADDKTRKKRAERVTQSKENLLEPLLLLFGDVLSSATASLFADKPHTAKQITTSKKNSSSSHLLLVRENKKQKENSRLHLHSSQENKNIFVFSLTSFWSSSSSSCASHSTIRAMMHEGNTHTPLLKIFFKVRKKGKLLSGFFLLLLLLVARHTRERLLAHIWMSSPLGRGGGH